MTAQPDFPFDHDLLRHVSPIEWKNVTLYGEIKIDPAKLRVQGRLRVFHHESGYYPSMGYGLQDARVAEDGLGFVRNMFGKTVQKST